ncbi:hypothetical protein FNB79_05380 [Formosa sediminum]|uniref:Uncharacterized protein n=1 Tax=Formosa sediminum TaxID=2594004 RepID=A0A516GPK2_9FLAO|nr:hypothetical protein [Formosa sediminum]QDO93432.1 hypothetical protein FNB79_05380 [Formosa sediminum]
MKQFTILVSIILCTACGLTKNNEAFAQNSAYNPTIEYNAINRGFFLEIKIQNQNILLITEQQGPDKIKALSDVEWDLLINKLHAIDLNSLSSLEAPSMKRAYDGAATAKLKVIEDSTIYSTTEFDHNNPNVKIKPLVDYILELAKTVD